jgi:hypothetical protein
MSVGIIRASGKLKKAVSVPVSHPYDGEALSFQSLDHGGEKVLRHDTVGAKCENVPPLLLRYVLYEAPDIGGLTAIPYRTAKTDQVVLVHILRLDLLDWSDIALFHDLAHSFVNCTGDLFGVSCLGIIDDQTPHRRYPPSLFRVCP